MPVATDSLGRNRPGEGHTSPTFVRLSIEQPKGITMSEGIRSPYRYRGSWLWPVDGYYDVHPDENGLPSDNPQAEGMSLAEAKQWVNECAWLYRQTGFVPTN